MYKKKNKKKLSHLNTNHDIQMVDISSKRPSLRRARCQGIIYMSGSTLQLIRQNRIQKGNVLTTAKIAGIQAAKQTDRLIPLCHRIELDIVDLGFELQNDHIIATSLVQAESKTGVEMEAFLAIQVALLTIYDMCKSVDRSMRISDILLLEKTGGRSSYYKSEILSINTSRKKGTPKTPVEQALLIKNGGIKSDAHFKIGSPRQISLLSTHSIEKMKKKGLTAIYGCFGENLTIKDVPLAHMPVGTKIKCEKGVILQVTMIGKECLDRCSIYKQMGDCVMPKEGIFARVLKGGYLKKGEGIIIDYENEL